MPGKLKLYHNPRSRAAIVRWMLEEVGADFEVEIFDFATGQNRKPEFLALNPMGKIPTLVLDDATVLTETPAIIAWLADAYPEARLAPAVGWSARGTYYRWLFFGSGCLEPALTEVLMRKDATAPPRASVGWGSYDDVIDTVENTLAQSPYLVEDRFTAADLYLAAQLGWAGMFEAPRIRQSRVIQDYVARATDRDAYRASDGV